MGLFMEKVVVRVWCTNWQFRIENMSLRMFTGSLRSLPECFEVKSENRWFWMMIAISWILIDFASKSIDLLTSGRFGRLIHFSCWVLTIIDEDPTFLPRIHTKKFQNPYRNVSEGFLSSNKQKSLWLAQIGSESLSADERRRTLKDVCQFPLRFSHRIEIDWKYRHSGSNTSRWS